MSPQVSRTTRLEIESVKAYLLIAAGLLTAGCAHDAPLPAGPTPFATDLQFETLPDHEMIGASLDWTVGQGRLAELSFAAGTSLPADYKGRPLIEHKWWPVTLVLFRPGGSWQDNDAYWLGLRRYPQPPEELIARVGEPPRRFVVLDNQRRDGWTQAGFTADPVRPEYVSEHPEKIYCWTFLALPPELTGKFIYEILLFPTATGTWKFYELGEPVVLQRGIFEIHAPDG